MEKYISKVDSDKAFIYNNEQCKTFNQNKYQLVDIYRDFDLFTANEFINQLSYQFFTYMMNGVKDISRINDLKHKLLKTIANVHPQTNLIVSRLFQIQKKTNNMKYSPFAYKGNQNIHVNKQKLQNFIQQCIGVRNNRLELTFEGTILLLMGMYGDESIAYSEFYSQDIDLNPFATYIQQTNKDSDIETSVLRRVSTLFKDIYNKSSDQVVLKRVIWQAKLAEKLQFFIDQIEQQMYTIYKEKPYLEIFLVQKGFSFYNVIEYQYQILNNWTYMFRMFHSYTVHIITELILEVLQYLCNHNFEASSLDKLQLNIENIKKFHSKDQTTSNRRAYYEKHVNNDEIQLIQTGYMLNPEIYREIKWTKYW